MRLYAAALMGIKVIDGKSVWAMTSDAILALDYEFAEIAVKQSCRQHFPESKGYSDWKYSLVVIPQNQAFNINSEEYEIIVQGKNAEVAKPSPTNTYNINVNGEAVYGFSIGEDNTINQKHNISS